MKNRCWCAATLAARSFVGSTRATYGTYLTTVRLGTFGAAGTFKESRLSLADPQSVHLMTQCTEAWIVADPEALQVYYGKGFNSRSLPVRKVLDDEPKGRLETALIEATKNTANERYHKIRHASDLLALISAHRVAARCVSFQQFVEWLDAVIAAA